MREVLIKSEGQLGIRYSKDLKYYILPTRLSTMRSMRELLDLIKQNKQIEKGPVQKISLDIRKKSKPNSDYDSIIKIPVIIKNCR
jgi:hypothetical protein